MSLCVVWLCYSGEWVMFEALTADLEGSHDSSEAERDHHGEVPAFHEATRRRNGAPLQCGDLQRHRSGALLKFFALRFLLLFSPA